jgi:hypothetical protein
MGSIGCPEDPPAGRSTFDAQLRDARASDLDEVARLYERLGFRRAPEFDRRRHTDLEEV